MWGMSMHLDAYNCHPDRIRNRTLIERFLKELVSAIDMVAHGRAIIEHFGADNKEGYTAIQLIETSAITIHFSEDTNSLYFDLFSCKEFRPSIVIDLLDEYFSDLGFKIEWHLLNRGIDISEEV